jgi:hypothetical protein
MGKRRTIRSKNRKRRTRVRTYKQSGRGYEEIVKKRKNLVPIAQKSATTAKKLEEAIQKALK